MPDPIQDELLRQVAALRGEVRFLRTWLLFVSLMVAVLFFAPPGLGAFLLGWALSFGEAMATLLMLVLAVIVAAVVAGRYVPKRPESMANATEDTTI